MRPNCRCTPVPIIPLDVTVTLTVERDADVDDVIRRAGALMDAANRHGYGLEGFARALPLIDGVDEVVEIKDRNGR